MASFTMAESELGVHAKTLVADTVDTVTVTSVANVDKIELISNGSAAIYFTLDGSAPTVAGANTRILPSGVTSVYTLFDGGRSRYDTLVLKLISSGTPTYSVQRGAI